MEWEIKGLPSYGPIAHLVGHPQNKSGGKEVILTKQQETDIFTMRVNGDGYGKIAKHIGCSEFWVRQYLREKKIKRGDDRYKKYNA